MNNSQDYRLLYQTQVSFTEWFEKINHTITEEMRKEDNEKRERLHLLHQIINLSPDLTYKYSAKELKEGSDRVKLFLEENKDKIFNLRLIPIIDSLPKLRMARLVPAELMSWFLKLNIDVEKYRADFVCIPKETYWSTIFIINNSCIFGEIISGNHNQLSQGFYEASTPITFCYNFEEWKISVDNYKALEELKRITAALLVNNKDKQKLLKEKLNSTFTNNYLNGYFETVTTSDYGLWFIDYNRILGRKYNDFVLPTDLKQREINENTDLITGISSSSGKVQGKVRIINDLNNHQFEDGEILVCKMTTPEHLHLMQRSAAIITDQGGILSHAAIVSRELKKPCITRTEKATEKLKDGDLVEVDADNGFVRKL